MCAQENSKFGTPFASSTNSSPAQVSSRYRSPSDETDSLIVQDSKPPATPGPLDPSSDPLSAIRRSLCHDWQACSPSVPTVAGVRVPSPPLVVPPPDSPGRLPAPGSGPQPGNATAAERAQPSSFGRKAYLLGPWPTSHPDLAHGLFRIGFVNVESLPDNLSFAWEPADEAGATFTTLERPPKTPSIRPCDRESP